MNLRDHENHNETKTAEISLEARLESWKEIGAYLQRNAVTARRWEKEEGLPVHRHSHRSRSSVYAYPSEIDAWRVRRRVVTETPPAGVRPTWTRPVAIAVTALLCLAMVGSGIRPAEAAGSQAKQNRQIWASVVEDFTESVPSPDGRYVAFTDWDTGELGIRDLRAGKSRRLTNNADWHASGNYDYAESPVVSPDNRQVAYSWWIDKERRTELRVSPTNGGAPRTFLRVERGEYYKLFGWTPDGKQVLAVRRDGACQVALISVQDGSVHVVKSFDRRDLSLNASVSPDGRYVAYDFPQGDNNGPRDIFIVPSGGGEAYELQHPANDVAPHWSADGSRIVFLSNRTGDRSLWSIEIGNGRPRGDAELVKTGMGNTVVLGITRSETLQYVVRGSSSSNIYSAELGVDLKALARPVRASERFINSNFGAQVSADGKLLAYLSMRPGGTVMVIRDLSTNEEREVRPRSLSVRRVTDYGPMWFPDHRSLLVVARDPEGPGFFRLDVGNGDEELLERFRGSLDGYGLSPDGKAILFVDRVDDSANSRLVRFDLDSKKETELKKGGWFSSVVVSPDSKQLAYLVTDQTVTHLMVMAAEGGESREVFRDSHWDGTERFNSLSWTPDRKFLIFVRAGSTSTGPRTLWKVAASGGPPEALGISVMGEVHSPQVLPDGERIFFAANETSPSEVWALENFLPRSAGKAK
jgi:Tol biopolymer transport system component